MSELHCGGCGVPLQSTDTAGVGFITPKVLRAALDATAGQAQRLGGKIDPASLPVHALCQRCYQLKHYGKLAVATASPRDWAQFVTAAAHMDALLVQVVDIFDLEDSTSLGAGAPGTEAMPDDVNADVRAALAARPTLVIVNKADLLPKSTHWGRVHNWLRARCKQLLPDRNVVGLVIASAKDGEGIEDVMEAIKAHRRGRDVVFLGAANVGKSSLVNRLLARLWLGSVEKLTSSPRARRRAARESEVLVLDELPPGYKPGDVYAGDWQALKTAAAVRRGASAGAPSGHELPGGLDPGAELHPTEAAVQLTGAAVLGDPHAVGHTATGTADGPDAAAIGATLSNLAAHAQGLAPTPGAESAHGVLPPQLRPRGFDEIVADIGGDASQAAAGPAALAAVEAVAALAVPLTTSPLPGTTLGVVSAPLTSTARAWDTPGLVVSPGKQALLEKLAELGGTAALRATAAPIKPLRCVHYRISAGKSLFLGGLARLDWCHDDPNTSILASVWAPLPVHIAATDRADELWERHAGDAAVATAGHGPSGHGLLQPAAGPLVQQVTVPAGTFEHSLRQREAERAAAVQHGRDKPSYKTSKRTIARRQGRKRRAVLDIALGGLGWVSFTPIEIEGTGFWDAAVARGAVHVAAADGVRVCARPAMLPFEAAGTQPKDWRTRPEPMATATSPLTRAARAQGSGRA